ncbi:MAG: hypothetical protein ACTMUB_04240 [cyanobacterium endosymbiont of Rhopalodia musculus]
MTRDKNMCGIAGIWRTSQQESIETMMGALIYRGPDARGMFIVPNGSGILGHQRLSIIDPEGETNESTALIKEKQLLGMEKFIIIPHCYQSYSKNISF